MKTTQRILAGCAIVATLAGTVLPSAAAAVRHQAHADHAMSADQARYDDGSQYDGTQYGVFAPVGAAFNGAGTIVGGAFNGAGRVVGGVLSPFDSFAGADIEPFNDSYSRQATGLSTESPLGCRQGNTGQPGTFDTSTC